MALKKGSKGMRGESGIVMIDPDLNVKVKAHCHLKDRERLLQYDATQVINVVDTAKNACSLIKTAVALLKAGSSSALDKDEAIYVIRYQLRRFERELELLGWRGTADELTYWEASTEALPVGRLREIAPYNTKGKCGEPRKEEA